MHTLKTLAAGQDGTQGAPGPSRTQPAPRLSGLTGGLIVTKLRDLIYFDFERAASIYSQIEGGLVKETQSGEVQEKDQRNIRKYDLKVFRTEFGGTTVDKSTQLTTRLLHHDLLVKLEEYLFDEGFGMDLSGLPENIAIEAIHSKVKSAAYVRARGWSILEDFDRLKRISGEHNRLIEFIGRCSMNQLEEASEFQETTKKLDAARARVDETKDRNKKAKEESKLRALEKESCRDRKRRNGSLGQPRVADGRNRILC